MTRTRCKGPIEELYDKMSALQQRTDALEDGKQDKIFFNLGSDGQVLANDSGSTYRWTNDRMVNVVDNLQSTSSTDALSANQGRVLKEVIDDVQDYAEAIGDDVAALTFTEVEL